MQQPMFLLVLLFLGKPKLYSHDDKDSAQKKNKLNLVIYNFTWGLNFIYIQQHL
jgi:hypothetical protein